MIEILYILHRFAIHFDHTSCVSDILCAQYKGWDASPNRVKSKELSFARDRGLSDESNIIDKVKYTVFKSHESINHTLLETDICMRQDVSLTTGTRYGILKIFFKIWQSVICNCILSCAIVKPLSSFLKSYTKKDNKKWLLVDFPFILQLINVLMYYFFSRLQKSKK